MEQFWAGGLAGVLCWLSVLPSDVVKSRMQADSLDPAARRYSGALDCVRQSLAKEGPGVFFRYRPIRGHHLNHQQIRGLQFNHKPIRGLHFNHCPVRGLHFNH